MTQIQLDYICEIYDLSAMKSAQGVYNGTEQHMMDNILQYEVSTSGTRSFAVAKEKCRLVMETIKESSSNGHRPNLDTINGIIGVR